MKLNHYAWVSLAGSVCVHTWTLAAQSPSGDISTRVLSKGRHPQPAVHGQSPLITIGPSTLVSKSQPQNDHTEILADADPENPKHLLVCTMIWSSEQNRLSSGIYASFDAGHTWKLARNDEGTTSVWDPACGYGIDGAAYFGAIELRDHEYDGMIIHRSDDAGRTWIANPKLPVFDREFLTADTGRGKFRGRLYLYGGEQTADHHIQLRLLYSADGGLKFQGESSVRARGKLTYRTAIFGAGAVLDDGTLLAPLRGSFLPPGTTSISMETHSIETISSQDGGVTLNEPKLVSDLGPDKEGCRFGPPVMAADRSEGPFRGRVYLAWGGALSRGPNRQHRCSIFLSRSDDHGATWSTPVVVDDPLDGPGAIGAHPFLPAISVNRSGVVGVVWYDCRRDPRKVGFHLRFSASVDGGETFLPSRATSRYDFSYPSQEHYPMIASSVGAAVTKTGQVRTSVAIAPRSYFSVGDTNGMAADANGDFHVFWIDNHTGVQQLYTAAVSVKENAIKNGSGALSGLQDVTDRVQLLYSRTAYDPATHSISIDLNLRNASKATLMAPLKLRLITLASTLGRPQATGTENSVLGSGAIWDLTGLMRGGQLRPDERASTRRLTFKIVGFRPLQGNRDRGGTFLQFDARVYAKTDSPSPAR